MTLTHVCLQLVDLMDATATPKAEMAEKSTSTLGLPHTPFQTPQPSPEVSSASNAGAPSLFDQLLAAMAGHQNDERALQPASPGADTAQQLQPEFPVQPAHAAGAHDAPLPGQHGAPAESAPGDAPGTVLGARTGFVSTGPGNSQRPAVPARHP